MHSISYGNALLYLKGETLTLLTKLGLRFAHVLFALISIISAQAFAEPSVQGIDRILKTIVSHNIVQYTYVLRINVDASSYTDSAFTVTTTNPDIVIVQNKVQLGNIDAGSFVRTTNSFSIRHNITKPFNWQDLVFKFEGKVAGISGDALDEATPQIGPVTFLELAGRPGHEGYYPIKSATPPSGKKVFLRATIFGQPTDPRYQFIDSNEQVLLEGQLFNTGDEEFKSPNYVAEVTIPDEPYRIKIVVNNADNSELAVNSFRTFTPATYAVNLSTNKTLLKRGKYGVLKIALSSPVQTGRLIVELILPDGLTGLSRNGRTSSRVKWSLILQPDQLKVLKSLLRADERLEPFTTYTATVITYFKDQPDIRQVSTQDFRVD